MSGKIGAVITGGDFQALGVVRTLARKSVPIIVLDSEHCISKYSRFCKKFFRSPHPAEEEAYVNFLIELAKKERIEGWVIFPNSDQAVYALSKHKETLEKLYRVPTPCWEIIRNVYIKKNTYEIAEKHQIPTPRTYCPRVVDDLAKLDIDFPLVIKPSVRDHFYNKVKIKAFRVNNREELLKTYDRVCAVIDSSEVLIQEFISGGPRYLYSFCPFFKEGEVVASVTARRTRQHPMDFGHASTFVELVDIPELRKIGEKLLRVIGYYGIGEVEFMFDSRNREYKLLEVNPRVWGWHTLAIAAGVDLPYMLYQDMVGEKINAGLPVSEVKWVRLITDIPTVFLEIVKGDMTLRDYIASMKGKKEFSVFDASDPLPFFVEIAMIPYLWYKRGF